MAGIQNLKIVSSDYTNLDVSSLPDTVSGQASTVKARFDALVKSLIVPRFNALIDATVPAVGDIEFNTTGTNPATKYGVGTWELWGAGKVPISVNAADTDFDAAEKTGGSKTGYAKIYVNGGDQIRFVRKSTATYNCNIALGGTGPNIGSKSDPCTYGVEVVGDSDANNMMPPYITCYMWKRTA